jgi:AcrR family transcriptional regulator
MVVDTLHLRADAARNLERILEAARIVFAERGLDASVADVAERAGVGTATIFRRFPAKDDLVAAILEREIERMQAFAASSADADDPSAGLTEFVTQAVRTMVEDRCLCEASGGELFNRPQMQARIVALTETLDLLLDRAQAAGAIRPDVVASDLSFLINAIGRAGSALERTAPGAWRRYVNLAIDGLRAEGASPLEQDAPTVMQLHESKHGSAQGLK